MLPACDHTVATDVNACHVLNFTDVYLQKCLFCILPVTNCCQNLSACLLVCLLVLSCLLGCCLLLRFMCHQRCWLYLVSGGVSTGYRRRINFRGHNILWVKFSQGQIFVGGGSPRKFNLHKKLFTGRTTRPEWRGVRKMSSIRGRSVTMRLASAIAAEGILDDSESLGSGRPGTFGVPSSKCKHVCALLCCMWLIIHWHNFSWV